MIKNEAQLQQAFEQLRGMSEALAALRRDVAPISRRQFALMAEGPLEEIRRLRVLIDEYTGESDVRELLASGAIDISNGESANPRSPA